MALSRPDRRCIVPVTSFCQWEGEKGAKRKIYARAFGPATAADIVRADVLALT